jgi:hypothetical protein
MSYIFKEGGSIKHLVRQGLKFSPLYALAFNVPLH